MTQRLVLAAYALLAASTQLLWLTFAAVDTRSAAAMHVSAGLVGDLAAVFPFVYIVLALPTGRWLDRRFGQALGAGAVLTAVGALLRLVAPTSFAWQLAGQVVISAGQPLVLNSINKVAARWFAPAERATAISVGTAALFAGILAAVLMAGPLMDAGGLPVLLSVQAAVAVVAAVLMLVALRFPARFPDDAAAAVSLSWLLRDRFMWTLAALVFIGMGVYNALATWLQPILEPFGEGDAAGLLIAVLTFAGIAGAAILPTSAARADRRRVVLLTALGLSTIAFVAVAVLHNVVWIGAWLFAAGFVLLAALPVVLDWSEIHAGPERQGAAVGFLMMSGNLGGLVVVLAVQAAIANPYLALGAMAAVTLLGLPVVTRLPARTRAA
ncbi:MAG TPA: MFS transporter [Candidatus Dormibacteraeota bacterium]|nr:MFS transporter [Candidatus Dormibacteraeota bacterium]